MTHSPPSSTSDVPNVPPGFGPKRTVRSRLIELLTQELMGPASPEEVSAEFPTTRYLLGRLAPLETLEDDVGEADPDFSVFEDGGDDTDLGDTPPPPPLLTSFKPSSFGLSFLLDTGVQQVDVELSWGDYEPEGDSSITWHRRPRQGKVTGLRVNQTGKLPSIPLHPEGLGADHVGVEVEGLQDNDVRLEGVVSEFGGYRAVSLFLVNRRPADAKEDRRKDRRWIFQPRMTVRAPDKTPIFVAKDAVRDQQRALDDDEASNALLYRHAREFATGHGVAAEWSEPDGDSKRTVAVWTEFIPSFEIPALVAPASAAGGACLDMRDLAEAKSGAEVRGMLQPILTAYRQWIAKVEQECEQPDIQGDTSLADAAKRHLRRCGEALQRMEKGLELIESDAKVFQAFGFANRAMWMQRTQAIWAARTRKTGERTGSPRDVDIDFADNRTWRPFQMGFILLNLRGVADPSSPDRDLVDLLWFPTGGGKTEAYLGLAAFTLALRRLKGGTATHAADAGVSVIMRYTLRLLTIQQFQRATALVAACEMLRRGDERSYGKERFRIGLWVGQSATPNTYDDAKLSLESGETKKGTPVQLLACPWCGEHLVDRGKPRARTYIADDFCKRILLYCPNRDCDFSGPKSSGQGIPVVVVDDEIYRMRPCVIIGTVDKFARLPFKGETQGIFGARSRYHPQFGHLTAAHKGFKGRGKDASTAAKPLLPPELIIQDELHLISGPLGTMVGLYETAVDHLTQIQQEGKRVRAKVIASTATIRRADEQVRQLYARELRVFPPSGVTARDSFFAKEVKINPEKDASAGRLYVGLNAPGSSGKTLMVRIYAALLASAQQAMDVRVESGEVMDADPYATLVGYFNSLRALGGAKRLVEDDVRVRLRYLRQQHQFPHRRYLNVEEMTSRKKSFEIPELLKRLDLPFPRPEKGQSMPWPLDVLLATNMISVGVDVDRLGLMVVAGQPKTTAEYIQATSRVGRKYPGLVVVAYNWLGARDLSHYERFRSYHAAIYRHVEAISATPFASRALDRGLHGVYVAMNRLQDAIMVRNEDAHGFQPQALSATKVIEEIVQRAAALRDGDEAERIRQRLEKAAEEWQRLNEDPTIYWNGPKSPPKNNARVLIRTSGSREEGRWAVPGSLREVEPTVAINLLENL
ncbi:hypothetical protein Dcar01_01419 [Deinococcus carri]|uniref:Helicase C-terminal domain-containing protein n=1 Tax=Deinococcus carri TaxID=1211323 RepID=A0ABP9W5T2_9DEIO